MLSIGAFSLVTGLSITALRHYDEVGLLTPAQIDPATRYRRYREDQIAQARVYARLRRLQVPVEAMRVAANGGVEAALREHRARLLAQAEVIAGLLGTVDR